jgi:hypothetical protein
VTALLGATVVTSLLVAATTLAFDLRRVRGAPARTLIRRGVGAAQLAAGLLWLLYGDLALRGSAGGRAWLAIAIGALFIVLGVRRLR